MYVCNCAENEVCIYCWKKLSYCKCASNQYCGECSLFCNYPLFDKCRICELYTIIGVHYACNGCRKIWCEKCFDKVICFFCNGCKMSWCNDCFDCPINTQFCVGCELLLSDHEKRKCLQ